MGRLRWIDVAKGLCMFLVVLMHCSLLLETQFNPGADAAPTFWWTVSLLLAPLRMPLFFFVSGYLVFKAVHRPLGVSRARTIGFFLLYVLWTGIFLLRVLLPGGMSDDQAFDPGTYLLALLLPTSFWYLWALAAFFLLTWVLVRLFGERAVFIAPVFLGLALASPWVERITIGWIEAPFDAVKFGSMALNFVWYFLGATARPQWDALMRSATRTKALIAFVVFAVAVGVCAATGMLETLAPLLALLALFTASNALAVLPLRGPFSAALERVGALTLPVYIFHLFAISAISAVAKITGLSSILTENITVVGVFLPPVLAVVITVCAMWLGRLILVSPMRWLLSPDWLKPGGARPQQNESASRRQS